MQTSSYLKSNAITRIRFRPTEDCRRLAQTILTESSVSRREFLADAVVNDLCQSAGIPPCGVTISDRPQKHRTDGRGKLRLKIYGFYRPQPPHITIYQKTAIRQQILAPKSFLMTLMHEFMHHYDHCFLHINSLHTSGFYQRLKLLREMLL